MIQHYELTEASDFKDVVKALDQLGMGFIAVTDKEGFLKGIVTDGDIRRAILKGNYDIQTLINANPEVMKHDATHREVMAKLKQLKVRHMPLVDAKGKFKKLFTIDNIEFVSKQNRVVIMAGGLGNRLGELTKQTPKPMLYVGEKPMLQHLIEMFSDHGYNKFLLCVNYKKNIIKDHFQSGKSLGVQIDYIEEDRRMGTAGALSLLNPAPDLPFFVINGDILTTLDFNGLLKFHDDSSSIATMCVRTHTYTIPYGVVKSTNENVISEIEEKPVSSFKVNAGIYILSPDVLKFVPDGSYFDMPSLFEVLIEAGHKTMVYHTYDYWIDVGRVEDFEKAKTDFNFLNNSRSTN